jgi:membrane protein DedA with SNARE-associated domain
MDIVRVVAILEPYFAQYGYLLVFFGVMLENSAMLGVIIPGETILIIAAFYAAQNSLNIYWVVALAFVGAVIGDNIGFWIGRKGGRRFLLKYGKYFFVKRQRLRAVEKYFETHGGKTIFIARFTAFLRALGAITAGSVKMPYKEFFTYNVLGAAAWSVVICLLGYFLGGNWKLIEKILRNMGLAALVLIVLVIGVAIYVRRRREKKREAELLARD